VTWIWLAIGAGLVILLTLIPLRVELFVVTQAELQAHVMLRWGMMSLGTHRVQIPAVSRKEPGATPRAGLVADARRWAKWRALFTSEDFLSSLGRWLLRLLRVIAPSALRVRVRMGAGDPAATGMLWASLAPLWAALERWAPAEITFEPDFLDQGLDLQLYARFRWVPLILVVTLLGYFFTPAPWRAWSNTARA
jgi:hypothetical protein